MPKAIKEHICMLCDLPIQKGEDYYLAHWVDWGGLGTRAYHTLKAHNNCNHSFKQWRKEWKKINSNNKYDFEDSIKQWKTEVRCLIGTAIIGLMEDSDFVGKVLQKKKSNEI